MLDLYAGKAINYGCDQMAALTQPGDGHWKFQPTPGPHQPTESLVQRGTSLLGRLYGWYRRGALHPPSG